MVAGSTLRSRFIPVVASSRGERAERECRPGIAGEDGERRPGGGGLTAQFHFVQGGVQNGRPL